jgi:hypothetical protein
MRLFSLPVFPQIDGHIEEFVLLKKRCGTFFKKALTVFSKHDK